MDSSHVLTKWPKAFSLNNFLKKVIEIQKYGFQTLKLTKIGIFSNLVRGLWNDPRQHLSIANVSEKLPFDVGKGPQLFFPYMETLFFEHFYFLCICMAILTFLAENAGSEASRSFPDHFTWLKICLKHFQMMFGRLLGGFFFIWKLFALTTFICYVYIGDFEILGVETLRREFSGEKFGTWVAWKFRPDSLLLKCCPNMPWGGAKEFPPSINFWKKLEQFESTIFTL